MIASTNGYSLKKNANKFLILLISADLLFFFFHITHLITTDAVGLAAQNRSPFALGKDLGLAESFQYVKEYWIILILAFLTIDRKKLIYLSWLILFILLMIDDIFQLHEQFGYLIARSLEIVPAFKLRPNDFGEILFVVIVGVIFALILVIPYFKSNRNLRQISHHFTILIIGLMLFGVVFDMIQLMVRESEIWFNIIGILEDGGEMLVISVFCWYVFLLTDQKENKSPFNYL